jgi:hypothetical protein
MYIGNLTLLRHDDSVAVVRTSDVSCATGAVNVSVRHDIDSSRYLWLLFCGLSSSFEHYIRKGTQNCML